MAGFADSPLAVTPYGTGTPVAAQAPPDDPPAEARYLDPATRDYERGTDGAYLRMPKTRQRVLLALTTLRDSSTVMLGKGLKLPLRMGPAWAHQAEIAVRAELAPLVADGSIRIDRVTVSRNVGRARILVDYVDLVTRQRDTVIT